MEKEILTFNDLPQVVAQLRDEVMGMRAMLTRQQAESSKPVKENRHKPMTVDEAIEYTHIPRGTMYMKLEDGTIPATKPGRRWILYQDELDKWLETKRRNTVPMTADEQNEAILASHKRKPNKSSWQTDPIVEPSKKVNVANATTSKPKAIAETDITPPTADAANDVVVSYESKYSNERTHSTASNSTVSFGDFNASDVTSSFDQLKVIYKKVGNNESQAFGVWQQLSESERTAAFAHTQRLQGDLSLRSYLYVYLRDKEWMKAM